MRRKALVITVLVVFLSTLPMWAMAMGGGNGGSGGGMGGGMGGGAGTGNGAAMGNGSGMTGGMGRTVDGARNTFSDHHGSAPPRVPAGPAEHHDGTRAGSGHHGSATGDHQGSGSGSGAHHETGTNHRNMNRP